MINLYNPTEVAAATEKQFEESRHACPGASLIYKHACGRMTDEQFEASRAAHPWASLVYKHSCDRMTEEQFDASRAEAEN